MSRKLMIQGTSSGVGKSILSIGLCRILRQDGRRVSPFKSQNMSGNAFLLENGLEMAKTQAIAAEACKTKPHVDMNPVLLKPLDGGTEVFVQGLPIGWMDRNRYQEYKKREAWIPILDSFRRLEHDYDVIILEGAGSPVEINMMDDDLANMNMARKAEAPVVLVADIERGGVFASVRGTLALLSEEDRKRVRGVIVNKCLGRLDLFDEVRSSMENMTGLPVLGMVPYLDVEIEDEDNLCDRRTGPKTHDGDLSPEIRQQQFDRLAESLRKHLDMPEIYKIIEHGLNSTEKSDA